MPNFDFSFFLLSISTGAGLAMDAFSVSLADGMNEHCMRCRKMCGVAGIFSLFQFAMPMIGWIFVSTLRSQFEAFGKMIPWIALILLGYIGGKMLYEGIQNKDACAEGAVSACLKAILLQGVATSIDALSVGFTISEYGIWEALLSCAIIGVVTFLICFVGLAVGKKAGTKLAGKAGILGGVILIAIGIKIFVESFL